MENDFAKKHKQKQKPKWLSNLATTFNILKYFKSLFFQQRGEYLPSSLKTIPIKLIH